MDNRDNFYKRVGKRIKALREGRKITQTELATMMGYGWNITISRWENGTREPSVYDLAKLSFMFDVSIEELIR